MEKHIKEYMIHCSELDNHIEKFEPQAIYCFDTESCFVNEFVKNIYENKLESEIKKYKDKVVKIYAWGLSNSKNDYVVYGENLNQFFETVNKICFSWVNLNQKLSENKVKNIKSFLNINIYVHNLNWDLEFLKYYLLENEFNYYNSKVKYKKKINNKKESKTFNVIENNNIVYSCNINLEGIKVVYIKKKKTDFLKIEDEVFPKINLLDSCKIMNIKLSEIGEKVIKIDDKFKKLGDTYDYDSIRNEGHILTTKEKMYLYNDVYILKEFINQFYKSMETKKNTASSISFEKFITGKYGKDKPYKKFEEHYPDLTQYNYMYKIIKESYRGGWTQVNNVIKGKHIKNINGTSIDINSSYPAVIKNKLLPYGIPTLYKGYKKCENNKLNLLVIEFDKFYNKDKNNKIGEIQVGAINVSVFNRNATEYIDSNIINGEANGTNLKGDKRYRLYIWEFELNSILENTVFEDYEVIETLCFKAEIGNFSEIVDFYTDLKIKAKKEKNIAMANFSKLVLNSFYGKLASNPTRIERKIILKDGIAKFENTDIFYEDEKKYYPAFASCVTAWARCNLREQLYKLCINENGNFENNVLYFDTDSLYTLLNEEEVIKKLGKYGEYDNDGNLIKILDKNGILDPYILGKWDIEKTYTEFKAIASKKYIVKETNGKITCKCAGLPDYVRSDINFDDFFLGNTFKGKKVKTKVRGGYALLKGDYTLNNNIFGGF